MLRCSDLRRDDQTLVNWFLPSKPSGVFRYQSRLDNGKKYFSFSCIRYKIITKPPETSQSLRNFCRLQRLGRFFEIINQNSKSTRKIVENQSQDEDWCKWIHSQSEWDSAVLQRGSIRRLSPSADTDTIRRISYSNNTGRLAAVRELWIFDVQDCPTPFAADFDASNIAVARTTAVGEARLCHNESGELSSYSRDDTKEQREPSRQDRERLPMGKLLSVSSLALLSPN